MRFKKRQTPTPMLKVLPGQPLDGRGIICVHLVVPDPKGPFIEPHVMRNVLDTNGQPVPGKVEIKAARCRIACDRKRRPPTKIRKGLIEVLMRSDDPRAVSCPKCKQSDDYKALMEVTEARSQ